MRDNLFNIKARVYGTVFNFSDLDNGNTFVFAEKGEDDKSQEPEAPQSIWLKLDARRAQRLGRVERSQIQPSQPVCGTDLIILPVVQANRPDYSLPPELR